MGLMRFGDPQAQSSTFSMIGMLQFWDFMSQNYIDPVSDHTQPIKPHSQSLVHRHAR